MTDHRAALARSVTTNNAADRKLVEDAVNRAVGKAISAGERP
jgi:hypothetical protein